MTHAFPHVECLLHLAHNWFIPTTLREAVFARSRLLSRYPQGWDAVLQQVALLPLSSA